MSDEGEAEDEPAAKSWLRFLPSVTILVIIAGVIALGAVILSAVPQRSSEFGLQGRSTSFELLSAEQTKTDSLTVTSAQLAGTMLITADPAMTSTMRASDLRLIAPSSGPPITLVSIDLPTAWSVRLEASGEGGLMMLAHPATAASAARKAIATFSLPKNTGFQIIADGSSQPVTVDDDLQVTAELGQFDLRLQPAKSPTDVFQALRPASISFEKEEADPQAEQGSTRPLTFGSLESGRLWVSHAKGVNEVSAIDRLSLAGIQNGLMRPVRLENGAIQFGIRGDAEVITNSPGSSPLSLKPSLLDLMIDNRLLQLLLGIVSFFASLQVANIIRTR